MDKNINDNDRIIIGVREWAFQTVLSDPWCGHNWEEDRLSRDEAKKRTTEDLLATAKKLEEYVLRDIGQSAFKPDPRLLSPRHFPKEKD